MKIMKNTFLCPYSNTTTIPRCTRCNSPAHRRSQDFLWGALFSFPSRKKLTTFLDVARKTRAKTTQITIPTAQICPFPKNGLLLCLGAHALPRGVLHLQLFLVNFAPFFLRHGGCTCTQCTPSKAIA